MVTSWRILAVAAAVTLAATAAGQAPECRNPQTSDFMTLINERALNAIRAKQDEIDTRIAAALLGSRGGNLLSAPMAIAGDDVTTCIATAPRVCAPRWLGGGCVGGNCITNGHYGFTGVVNEVYVENNAIDVTINDATVCAIQPHETGMDTNITGHLTITVGEVDVSASLSAYARLALTISGTIGVGARFRLDPLRVGWEAEARMEYLHPERACTITNFHEVAINFPAPRMIDYTIDRSGFWGTITSAVSAIAELITGDLTPQLQTAINAAWTSRGVEQILEERIRASVSEAEEGVSITCPSCPPGQSGTPVMGCNEINACINWPCLNNSICADLASPREDNAGGRTCTACTDGTRPRQGSCQDCIPGTAGTGGRCTACNINNNQYAATGGQRQCSTMADCPAGTYVATQPSATAARTCTAVPDGHYTDDVNQNEPRAWQVCQPGTRISTEPSASRNRECVSCPENEYQPNAGQSRCEAMTICQPGERQTVAPASDNSSDRACGMCPDNFFSNTTNSLGCQRHRVCPDHQFIENNGSRIRDYICGDHTDCIPGSFVTRNASRHVPRECGACPENMFTDAVNQFACRPHTDCSPGQSVEIQALPGLDRSCAPCPEGEFSDEVNADSCAEWTTCQPGQFDSSELGPTSQSDRDCQTCADGRFSLGSNSSDSAGPGRRHRRQEDPDTVWLCADECRQTTDAMAATASTIPCVELVVGECTEIAFGAFEVSDYLVTPSGAFYWKLTRTGNEYALHMHPNSRCDSDVNTPTVPVIPTDDILAIDTIGPLIEQFNFCTASSSAGCTQIMLGMTIDAAGLDTCTLIDFHTSPSYLRFMIESQGDTVPIVYNLDFKAQCRPVVGDPSSCPQNTQAATTRRATTTVPGATIWPGCAADQFECATVNQCIPVADRCNGHLNCPDDSDEASCAVTTTVAAATTLPSETEPATATVPPATTTFMANPNTDSCEAWRTCRPGEFISVNGTTANNRECEACVAGVGFTDLANLFSCILPRDCPPGTVMVQNTTVRSDRQCAECDPGYFTTEFNSVTPTPWSNCTPGTHMSFGGSTTGDRVCSSCLQNVTFQPESNQEECNPVTNCPGGMGVAAPTLTTDRTCSDCPDGTFKDPSEPHDTSCIGWRSCAAGFFVSSNGSSMLDRGCAACPAGRFADQTNAGACSLPTPCAAGTFLHRNVTAVADQMCQDCIIGSFSSTAGNQRACTPWTECNQTLGYYERGLPNATADRDCVFGVIDSDSSSAGKAMDGGEITGIAIGALVFLALVGALAFYTFAGKKAASGAEDGARDAAFENPLYSSAQPTTLYFPDDGLDQSADGSGGSQRRVSTDVNLNLFAGYTDVPAGSTDDYLYDNRDIAQSKVPAPYLDVEPAPERSNYADVSGTGGFEGFGDDQDGSYLDVAGAPGHDNFGNGDVEL